MASDPLKDGRILGRRFGSIEEIERVFFPRLYKERRKSEWLRRELEECGEALTACEEAHGVQPGATLR